MNKPTEFLYWIEIKRDDRYIPIRDEGAYYSAEAARRHAESEFSTGTKFRIVGYQLFRVGEECTV